MDNDTRLLELFDLMVPFRRVRVDDEFLLNGNVYRKLNHAEADKVNWPGAGNIIDVPDDYLVRVPSMDYPSERHG